MSLHKVGLKVIFPDGRAVFTRAQLTPERMVCTRLRGAEFMSLVDSNIAHIRAGGLFDINCVIML